VVDDEDAHLGERNWQLSPDGYASRSAWVDGKRRTQMMHRIILGLDFGDPLTGDHIDGDRLDNRRQNLRVLTKGQQAQNKCGHPGTHSRFRGVTWHKRIGKWMAQVSVNRHLHHLGYFDDEEEAARVASDFRRTALPHSNEQRSGHGAVTR
jgi:AP2 domain/HNH endonuclease